MKIEDCFITEKRYTPLGMTSRTAVMPTSTAFYEARYSNINLIKYKLRSVLHNKNLNYRQMIKLNGLNCFNCNLWLTTGTLQAK
jgi:hypothetical protein